MLPLTVFIFAFNYKQTRTQLSKKH